MMNNKTINIEIEELAERYFDGTTTVDEERRLRRLLASTAYSSPTADEVRALLGFFAAERSRAADAPRRRVGLKRRILSVAVSVAVLVVATIALFRYSDSNMECYAMVGSERIEDINEIRALVDADLVCISDAQNLIDDAIAADLSAISDAMQ